MRSLNICNFVPHSCANGPGQRAVIWVQGCPLQCPGCFNPNTQAFVDKKLIDTTELLDEILSITNIEGVTFSGGEPFSQAKPLSVLAKKLRESGLTITCYTGYTVEQLRLENHKDWNFLLSEIDLLIDGPFLQQKQCNAPYRGSENQRLHFLSNKIDPNQIMTNQTAEINLNNDGSIIETGFPELF